MSSVVGVGKDSSALSSRCNKLWLVALDVEAAKACFSLSRAPSKSRPRRCAKPHAAQTSRLSSCQSGVVTEKCKRQ